MRRQELKLVEVVYCDVCGDACTGAWTIFNQGTPEEKHGCHGWIEAEQTRCDLKLADMLHRGTPIPDVHARSLAGYIARCREDERMLADPDDKMPAPLPPYPATH